MHFKEVFITENIFLLLHSKQIRFWLLKQIKSYSDWKEIKNKQVTILLVLVSLCCPAENAYLLDYNIFIFMFACYIYCPAKVTVMLSSQSVLTSYFRILHIVFAWST